MSCKVGRSASTPWAIAEYCLGNRWITTLGIGIVILSTALVIGRHFDARWAGGEGWLPTSKVVIEKQSSPSSDIGCESVDATRQNILSCGSMMKVTFGSSTLWLDEKTALVVADDRQGKETLTMDGGRIVVQGSVIIHVRDLAFSTTGTMSLVNYSWLNRVDVLAMTGEARQGSIIIPQSSATSFDTLPPYEPSKTIDFNTQNPSVKAFYDFATD